MSFIVSADGSSIIYIRGIATRAVYDLQSTQAARFPTFPGEESWIDWTSIPLTAPALTPGSTAGVLERRVVPLQRASSSGGLVFVATSASATDITRAVPAMFDPAGSYKPVLVDAAGTTIPYDGTNWFINSMYESAGSPNIITGGVICSGSIPPLTAAGTTPVEPLTLTYYRYSGATVTGTGGGGGISSVTAGAGITVVNGSTTPAVSLSGTFNGAINYANAGTNSVQIGTGTYAGVVTIGGASSSLVVAAGTVTGLVTRITLSPGGPITPAATGVLTLTAGTGVTLTGGPGSVTIASTGFSGSYDGALTLNTGAGAGATTIGTGAGVTTTIGAAGSTLVVAAGTVTGLVKSITLSPGGAITPAATGVLTLIAGSGIILTAGTGSVTIAATGGGFSGSYDGALTLNTGAGAGATTIGTGASVTTTIGAAGSSLVIAAGTVTGLVKSITLSPGGAITPAATGVLTLIAGSGVTLTAGTGSVTVAATGGGFSGSYDGALTLNTGVGAGATTIGTRTGVTTTIGAAGSSLVIAAGTVTGLITSVSISPGGPVPPASSGVFTLIAGGGIAITPGSAGTGVVTISSTGGGFSGTYDGLLLLNTNTANLTGIGTVSGSITQIGVAGSSLRILADIAIGFVKGFSISGIGGITLDNTGILTFNAGTGISFGSIGGTLTISAAVFNGTFNGSVNLNAGTGAANTQIGTVSGTTTTIGAAGTTLNIGADTVSGFVKSVTISPGGAVALPSTGILTIAAGSGITLNNTAGTITIASPGGGFTGTYDGTLNLNASTGGNTTIGTASSSTTTIGGTGTSLTVAASSVTGLVKTVGITAGSGSVSGTYTPVSSGIVTFIAGSGVQLTGASGSVTINSSGFSGTYDGAISFNSTNVAATTNIGNVFSAVSAPISIGSNLNSGQITINSSGNISINNAANSSGTVFIGAAIGTSVQLGNGANTNIIIPSNTVVTNIITRIFLNGSTITQLSNGNINLTAGTGITLTNPVAGQITITNSSPSDRALKENFVEISCTDILNRIDELPVSEWNYIADDDRVRNVGPMVQDWQRLFPLGRTEPRIDMLEFTGITIAAVKGLAELRRTDLAATAEENAELRRQVADLATAVAGLTTQLAECLTAIAALKKQ